MRIVFDKNYLIMTSLEVFILLFLSCMIERSLSLSCPCWAHDSNPLRLGSYREMYCSDLNLQCPPGSEVISDHCGCCKVCSHVENEECAGPWEVLGQCAKDYECIDPRTKAPVVTDIYPNTPRGTCQRIKLPGYERPPSTTEPSRSMPIYPPGFSLIDFFGPMGPQAKGPVNQAILPPRKNKKTTQAKKEKKLRKELMRKARQEKKERRERKIKEARRQEKRKGSKEVSNEIPKFY